MKVITYTPEGAKIITRFIDRAKFAGIYRSSNRRLRYAFLIPSVPVQLSSLFLLPSFPHKLRPAVNPTGPSISAPAPHDQL